MPARCRPWVEKRSASQGPWVPLAGSRGPFLSGITRPGRAAVRTFPFELEARLSKPPPASHPLKPPTDDTDRHGGKTRHCLVMRGRRLSSPWRRSWGERCDAEDLAADCSRILFTEYGVRVDSMGAARSLPRIQNSPGRFGPGRDWEGRTHPVQLPDHAEREQLRCHE